MSAAGVFGAAFLVVAYVYAGFPALLWVLARFRGRPHRVGDELPHVVILVAAHQEALVIRDKLENFLDIDYPADRLRMVVVSDGSDDGTDEIAAEFAGERIALLRQEPRQGKAAALGLALAEIDDEIVLFTDANVLFEPDAVRLLVRHFADREVGVVTGTVQLVDRKLGYAESEGAYYRYERFIQLAESRYHSVVGVDGAMYAARRALVAAPPVAAILDDFIIAMDIAARGHRIVYEPDALAREDAAPDMSDEFRRKVRVATGAFQSLAAGWGVPGFGVPRLLLCYVSHKVLRWAAPWLLLAMLAANAVAATTSVPFAAIGVAHAGFYLLAIAGLAAPPLRGLRVVAVPMYFTLMNAAVGYGLLRVLGGRTHGRWKPTRRTQLRSS